MINGGLGMGLGIGKIPSKPDNIIILGGGGGGSVNPYQPIENFINQSSGGGFYVGSPLPPNFPLNNDFDFIQDNNDGIITGWRVRNFTLPVPAISSLDDGLSQTDIIYPSISTDAAQNTINRNNKNFLSKRTNTTQTAYFAFDSFLSNDIILFMVVNIPAASNQKQIMLYGSEGGGNTWLGALEPASSSTSIFTGGGAAVLTQIKIDGVNYPIGTTTRGQLFNAICKGDNQFSVIMMRYQQVILPNIPQSPTGRFTFLGYGGSTWGANFYKIGFYGVINNATANINITQLNEIENNLLWAYAII